MDVKELIKEVRRIEIRSRMIVNQISGGAYRSRFKGRGMEFEEVREYVPGDDIRDIDWNVTARMGLPFIKKYAEEREVHVLIAVDVSGSTLYGSQNKSKIRVQTELAATLALNAVRNNDKVGLITFTDGIELRLPMRSGRGHVLRIIRELVGAEPHSPQTDIGKIFSLLNAVLNKRTVIFFISDMAQTSQDFLLPMRMLGRAHDLILCRVTDPVENIGLPPGNWALADAETRNRGFFHASSSARKNFIENAQERLAELKKEALRAHAGFIDIHCGEDFVAPMTTYFNRKRRRS